MGLGLAYLGWRRRAMRAAGEGYGAPETLVNEPEAADMGGRAVHPLVALLPLLVVGLGNLALTMLIPRLAAGEEVSMSLPGLTDPVAAKVAQVAALWAVEGARSEERRVGQECVSTCRPRW